MAWAVVIERDSGYAGKSSNDPEWIMQDPRGYPEMEKEAQQSIWDVTSE